MTNIKIKKRVLVFSKVKTRRKGDVRKLNNDFGDYEMRTVDCLADFGINIIVNKPSSIPGSKNADLTIDGAFWEIKTLLSANDNTLNMHFKKAAKQANGRAIFDIRFYAGPILNIEEKILRKFIGSRSMRKMMILKNDTNGLPILVDLSK
jgi:hypothetical protein